MKENLEIDITNKIMNIEKLKVKILKDFAILNECLLLEPDYSKEELLSEIIINSYLLSLELGKDFETINQIIKNKIRLGILKEDINKDSYIQLGKFFDTRK